MNIDDADKKLLNLIQVEFPLTSQPYADLGRRLGIDGNEVVRRIEQLKVREIIRQIGPVIDARSLGYQSVLAAISVDENQMDAAERVISRHPGVSHGYERNHYFNIWFTLAAPPEADIKTEVQQLTSHIKNNAIVILPAIKVYKIGAFFNMDDNGDTAGENIATPGKPLAEQVRLSQTDRLIVNEIQQDLSLVPTPFMAIAARLNISVDDLLVRCQSLLQRGVIRRFSASINHQRAGFKANGMACWVASADVIDVAGQKLASLPEVSHCYERATSPLWQYNLFAMIHKQTREACREIANKVSLEFGLTDSLLLFSTKEFKKTRIKYTV